MKAETELQIKRLYRVCNKDDRIPIIFVSSPPVGAFLAPMLASKTKRISDVLTQRMIDTSIHEAEILALGDPGKRRDALVNTYYDVLSHENDGGNGAAIGARSLSMTMLRYSPGTNTPATRTRRPLSDPAHVPLDSAVLPVVRGTTEYVRERLHMLFKRRVRYHGVVTKDQLDDLACLMFWPNLRFCVVTQNPTVLLRNNNRQAHSTERYAIKFRDGWGVAAVSGVHVPSKYIENPVFLTPDVIRRTKNVETKRALMELYGYERWLTESKATLLHTDRDQDDRPRKLWHLHVDGRQDVNLLEVFNSTPELDGEHKKYFLQVPRDRNNIQNALSWMVSDRMGFRNLTMRIET